MILRKHLLNLHYCQIISFNIIIIIILIIYKQIILTIIIVNEVNETDNINNEKERENELRNVIATFHNITHNACNDLLHIFRQFTSYNIPTDIRTLFIIIIIFTNPRKTNVLKICGREYFYSGFRDIIKKML